MNSKTLSCIKSYKREGIYNYIFENCTTLKVMVSSLSDKDEVYSKPFI